MRCGRAKGGGESRCRRPAEHESQERGPAVGAFPYLYQRGQVRWVPACLASPTFLSTRTRTSARTRTYAPPRQREGGVPHLQ